MRRFGRMIVAGVLACCSPHVLAASLRDAASVSGTHVHLSDLFAGLAAGQDVAIGPAPALGQSYVVGGAQLTAIAAQFGVDWPEASPLLSITVTRATHTIGEGDVIAALRPALQGAGETAETSIVLNGFHSVNIPAETPAALQVLDVSYAPERGEQFSARIVAGAPDAAVTIAVAGTVALMRQAYTMRHAVRAGDPVAPDDLQSVAFRASLVPEDAIRAPSDAVGLVARVSLAPGRPLLGSQLVHPMVIGRGDPVVIAFAQGSLRLTASGFSLQPGGRGDIVRVFNPATNMILTTRIADRGAVDILPGAMPVSADHRAHMNTVPVLPVL